MPFMSVGGSFYNKNEWTSHARFVGASGGVGSFPMTSTLPTEIVNLNIGGRLTLGKHFESRLEYGGRLGDHFRASSGTFKVNYLF